MAAPKLSYTPDTSWNTEYPDYTVAGLQANGVSPAEAAQAALKRFDISSIGGAAAPIAASSLMGPVGLGIGLLGTAASAYGTYEQGKQAQRQYELAVKAWQAEKDRQERIDAQTQAQQYFTNALATANYGQGVTKNAADEYGKYARSYGL